MGIIARQSFKSSIAIYLGILIGIANRIYFYPKFLTESELGLITVILAIASILSQFSFLGTSTTITKFYDYFKKKNQLDTFTGYFLSIPILGFLIFGVLFLLFKNQVISYYFDEELSLKSYYYLVLPLSLLMLGIGILFIYSINNLRLTVPSLLQDFFLKLLIMIGLIFIATSIINFRQFVYYIIGSYFIIFLLLATYCYKVFSPKISFKFKTIERKDYRKITNYSGFVFLGGISGSVMAYTDTLMLSSLEGFGATGIYTIGFFIGMAIEIPKRAISLISAPIISKYWNENNESEINSIYKKTSINQGAIGLLFLLLLWINLDELFSLLPNSEIYSTGKYVAIFIGLSRVVDMFSGVNSEILQTSKKYKSNFVLTIGFIFISILLNLILIPIYKLNGAAIASLISVFSYNLVRYILLRSYFNFTPFTLNSLKLLLIFTATLGIGLLTPETFENTNQINISSNIIIKSLILGGAFTSLVYYYKISLEINEKVNLFCIRSYSFIKNLF